MRTGAIELAEQVRQQRIDPGNVDALFVTSLMSAADLRALLPAGFRDKPMIVYMHENQAAYPAGDGGDDPRDAHFPLTNLTSMAAADRVIFNSAWNRESFMAGARELLEHSRDGRFDDVLAAIEAESCVIWPPVEPPPSGIERPSRILHNPTRVVWPHRWEHDKGPDGLLEVARHFTRSHNVQWIILGQRYERIPAALETFQREFADRIDHVGFVEDRDEYWRWLARADWVLSTARHEFFGIAVVEALLPGALPWLPPELSYPELLPQCAKGLSPMNPPEDVDGVRRAIRAHLEPALATNSVRRIDNVIEELFGSR